MFKLSATASKNSKPSLLVIFICCISILAISLASCSKKTESSAPSSGLDDKPLYDYDLSEFVKLGQYKGVEVTKHAAAVTDEEVESQLSYVLYSQSTSEKIMEGTLKSGDTANIDYIGRINGEPFDGGSDQNYNLTLGSGIFIPGFEDQLVGRKVGETVIVNVTFPGDYNNPGLAGVAAEFEVKINHIMIQITPELSDEFIQTYTNNEYKTIDEYKEYLRNMILSYKESELKNQEMSDVWTVVKNNCQIIKYPEAEVANYKNEFLTYYTQAAAQAEQSLESYVQSQFQMTLDDFNNEAEKYAEGYVGEEMIFYSIARAEGIKITDELYKKGIDGYLEQMTQFNTAEELEANYSKTVLENSILWDEVIYFLTQNAVEVESSGN